MSLFAELKRRNVFRVAIAYVVLAWLILQVGDTLAPALHLPDWINSALAFFLLLGFPLAIFFAWVFEMTPEGLKREKDVDRSASITPATGRKLDRSIIALLAVALAYFIWQSRVDDVSPDVIAGSADSVDGQQSIAVLPFVNMSSDQEQEFFSDGLSEELLNLLAKIPELKVTSRTSAFSYKGKEFRIAEVGRELNVDHVLEGSVRKSGDKVRITAQLIKVDDDTHLWSETWDRTLNDVFVIQDEIAEAVVNELKVRLLGELPQAIEADPEAFSLYLQARHAANQRTRPSLARAEDMVSAALDIDPDYVPGWVLKAHIHSVQGDTGFSPFDVAYSRARAAAEKALELDPEFGAAHAMLGDVLTSYYRDFPGARREIERALELDPGNVDTLYQACGHYGVTGAVEYGIELCKRALDRDPLFPPLYPMIGYLYQVLHEPDIAFEWMSHMIDIAPGAYGTHYYATLTLVSAGRLDEAKTRIEQETLDGFKETGRALVYTASGERDKADAALHALQKIKDEGWYYQLAMVQAYRGEVDEAIATLDEAIEKRDSGAAMILGDPYLDNIRDDPRFEPLVERMGIRLD